MFKNIFAIEGLWTITVCWSIKSRRYDFLSHSAYIPLSKRWDFWPTSSPVSKWTDSRLSLEPRLMLRRFLPSSLAPSRICCTFDCFTILSAWKVSTKAMLLSYFTKYHYYDFSVRPPHAIRVDNREGRHKTVLWRTLLSSSYLFVARRGIFVRIPKLFIFMVESLVLPLN